MRAAGRPREALSNPISQPTNEIQSNMATFDFHTHSHFSDGEHSPRHLAKIATAAGIKQLALTDHDCVDGLAELKSHSLNLEIINGKFSAVK